jgi:hypothetical protein
VSPKPIDASSPALVAAAIAFVGVLVSTLVSATVSKRATYISTVTAERSKWIDKLRNNISRLISLLHTVDREMYRDHSFSDTKQFGELSAQIVEAMALVRLQLNPAGKIDINILALLFAAQDQIGEQDYKAFERLFVRHVQWLLKEEWEKVKYEARGPVGKLWAAYKKLRRKSAYENFCAHEGAIQAWL